MVAMEEETNTNWARPVRANMHAPIVPVLRGTIDHVPWRFTLRRLLRSQCVGNLHHVGTILRGSERHMQNAQPGFEPGAAA